MIGGFVRLEGVRLGEVDGIWLEIGSAIPGDLVGNASKSEYGGSATQSMLSRASK